MTPKLAISVSYYGRHRKGDGQVMDADQHEDMLRRTIRYLQDEMAAHKPEIVVCAGGCTRFDSPIPLHTWVMFDERETSNAEGSWLAICNGIRVAMAEQCEYLIHTAEDVLPHRGVMADMLYRMHTERLDYLGHLWRPFGELATQFFGCRPSFFASIDYDMDELASVAQRRNAPPEVALGMIFGTYGLNDYVPGTRKNVGLIPQSYEHTHDYKTYLKLLEELKR